LLITVIQKQNRHQFLLFYYIFNHNAGRKGAISLILSPITRILPFAVTIAALLELLPGDLNHHKALNLPPYFAAPFLSLEFDK